MRSTTWSRSSGNAEEGAAAASDKTYIVHWDEEKEQSPSSPASTAVAVTRVAKVPAVQSHHQGAHSHLYALFVALPFGPG